MTQAAEALTRWAARSPVSLGEVESTQADARRLAEAGAPEGTVVRAEHQTRGRGRLGRSWLDEPSASLLMSVILRPTVDLSRIPQLSLVAGVAAAEAISSETGVPISLAWPNDLLAGGRKLAGILAESFVSRGDGGAVVVILGIGINVNQRHFPSELAGRATSLSQEAGHHIDRERLLPAVLERLEAWYRRWNEDGFGPVRDAWRRLSVTLGRRVGLDGGADGGTVADLAEDGALLVRTDAGLLVRVIAGELLQGEGEKCS